MVEAEVQENAGRRNQDASTSVSGHGNSVSLPRNLDVIQDVSVNLSMVLGRTKITIRELLQLNPSSVIELDRTVDEHMDILVNGTLIAHGEVVVINEKFGVRLTDIVSPMERVSRLK